MNMEINNVVLLDATGKRNLQDFSHSGVDRIDYDAYLVEVRPSGGNQSTRMFLACFYCRLFFN